MWYEIVIITYTYIIVWEDLHMSEKKFCTNCGAPLRDDGQFCTECGTKVKEDFATVTQATSTENPNQGVVPTVDQNQPQYTAPAYSPIPDDNQMVKSDKQGKVIIGVFGAIAALAIIFFVYKGFFAYPSKPADVAKKCFNAMMIDYDSKEAQKYFELDEVDYEEIKELCDGFKYSGMKIKEIKVLDTEIEGNYAEVTLSLTASWLGETETEEGEVSLQKIDGKWKIIDFN